MGKCGRYIPNKKGVDMRYHWDDTVSVPIDKQLLDQIRNVEQDLS